MLDPNDVYFFWGKKVFFFWSRLVNTKQEKFSCLRRRGTSNKLDVIFGRSLWPNVGIVDISAELELSLYLQLWANYTDGTNFLPQVERSQAIISNRKRCEKNCSPNITSLFHIVHRNIML